jgi:AcrR family transcriptional regulator
VGVSKDGRSADAERLSADQRREALLDVTRVLVMEGGTDAVTMGTIAERSGVTRALVYKHFDNRDEALLALYRREAASLDAMLRRVVLDAGDGLEAQLRALVEAIIDTADRYGSFFRLLRGVSGSPSARADRRGWDRRTVRYFASLVQDETDLDEHTARTATALVLTALPTVRAQALADPERRQSYVDTYVDVFLGAFDRLSDGDRQPVA